MSGNARPLHAARGEGDSLRNPVATAGPLEIKARGEETGGMLTACESVTMPGEGPPFHKHANETRTKSCISSTERFAYASKMRSWRWRPARSRLFHGYTS